MKKNSGFDKLLPVLFFASLALMGCQQTAGGANDGPQVTGASADKAEEQPQVAQALPPLAGPKRTVAVGKFDAIGSFTSKYGDWDIGGGLAAMLTSALVNSERFVVVERAELKEILSEQELKAGGLTNPETGPKLGKLAGVQFLIYGAVTEFGTQDKGGGVNFGFMGGGRSPFSLGGAQESASGKVAMDIRVVDTTTGEVLESHTVSQQIENSAFNLSAGFKGISLGGDKFDKTPLGEATRATIEKAVQAISVTASGQPWMGQVVDVDGSDVVINAGLRSGLKSGDMFMIERVVKTFTDPATGQVLGTKRNELGLVRITDVKEKLAFGPYSPLEKAPPKRGDLVVLMVR
jgi:curli biogenesis system outer membrane secretion channel CsgG